MNGAHPGGAQGHHNEQDLLVLHAAFNDTYVLLLNGTADSTTQNLHHDFARATASGLRLLIDLAGLCHGDKSLLHLLLDAHRQGAELIGPLSPSLRQRLAITGLTHWFTVHPDLTTALRRPPPRTAPGT